MKTTLEIADPLLAQVKKIVARDGATSRSLVEQGLRKVVADRNSAKGKPFRCTRIGANPAFIRVHAESSMRWPRRRRPGPFPGRACPSSPAW